MTADIEGATWRSAVELPVIAHSKILGCIAVERLSKADGGKMVFCWKY